MGSLTAFAYECGEKNVRGGSARLYLLAYGDAKETNGVVYSISESGEATLTLQTGKSFVNIGLIKTGGLVLSEGMTVADNGVYDITQTLTLAVTGINKKSRKLVNDLKCQPVIAIVKTKQGNILAYGLDGNLQLSESTNTLDDTNNGYSIVLSGSTIDFAPEITEEHLATLIAAAA